MKKLTILTPTMNRPDFIKRMLDYYVSIEFQDDIVIGDSSNDENRSRNQETIDRLKNKIHVKYKYFENPPYLHDGMCMRDMVAMAETPYVVYSGDDDFLIPEGLSYCIKTLELHPELTAVFGLRVIFKLDRHGAWGRPMGGKLWSGPEFMEDKPSARLQKYLQNGLSTQYFVHRISVWEKMYEHVFDVPSRYLGPELLPCCYSVMCGKIKRINMPTLVFQKNFDQIFSWDKTSFFDLINNAKWPPSIDSILTHVSNELSELEKIDGEAAKDIVKKEIWSHITQILFSQFKKAYVSGNVDDGIDMHTLRNIMSDPLVNKFLQPVFNAILA